MWWIALKTWESPYIYKKLENNLYVSKNKFLDYYKSGRGGRSIFFAKIRLSSAQVAKPDNSVQVSRRKGIFYQHCHAIRPFIIEFRGEHGVNQKAGVQAKQNSRI